MLKILLPVDGSECATRATNKLIESLDWYKERPQIDVVAVHLPVPKLPNMSLVVSKKMLDGYYDEESEAMLAPSRKELDDAGIAYTEHRQVGPIAETIIEQAKHLDCNMIYMGTRGMSTFSNMLMGSTTTKVLHLAHIPVVLIH